MTHILAIDQGTTSSRAILFDDSHVPVATSQKEFDQHFPQSGWVEHSPEDIWETTLAMCREAIAKAGARPSEIARCVAEDPRKIGEDDIKELREAGLKDSQIVEAVAVVASTAYTNTFVDALGMIDDLEMMGLADEYF